MLEHYRERFQVIRSFLFEDRNRRLLNTNALKPHYLNFRFLLVLFHLTSSDMYFK